VSVKDQMKKRSLIVCIYICYHAPGKNTTMLHCVIFRREISGSKDKIVFETTKLNTHCHFGNMEQAFLALRFRLHLLPGVHFSV
jgi:hypothetical protein